MLTSAAQKIVVKFIALSCVMTALISGCTDWSTEKIKESHRRGDAIVVALEAYKQKSRVYPSHLEELTPNYIERLKPPVAGNGRWN